MTETHTLLDTSFGALAAGRGGVGTCTALQTSQLSKHKLLLRNLMDVAGRRWPAEFAAAGVERSYDILAQAEERNPAAVREVLGYPLFGAWVAHCLRRACSGEAGPVPLHIDLAHLAAVAGVAAVRAGADCTLRLPVRDGLAHLPGLGAAVVGGRSVENGESDEESGDWAELRIIGRDAVVTVGGHRVPVPSSPHHDAAGWLGLRQLRAEARGESLTLLLDDLHPYRDCHRLSARGRLAGPEVQAWQDALDEAWDILVQHMPWYGEPIRLGLGCVVPLCGDGRARGMAATSGDAFGAVAMTPPADATSFAVGMVHEFQHGKLGAVLDLMPLLEPGDGGLHYSPWRDDPRPLGGLLHGAYAYLGVTDFWRVMREQVATRHALLAQFELARWRDAVRRTTATLSASGRLTAAGRTFVGGMGAAVQPWCDVAVDPAVALLARSAATDHNLTWRLRNLRPAPSAVRQLASQWLAGAPRATPTLVVTAPSGRPRTLEANPRLDLVRLMLTDRTSLGRPLESLRADIPAVSAADLAYGRGDLPGAVNLYSKSLAEPVAEWAGMALAVRRLDRRSARALAYTPELVRAVHLGILAEAPRAQPDPLALADWLAPVTVAWHRPD